MDNSSMTDLAKAMASTQVTSTEPSDPQAEYIVSAAVKAVAAATARLPAFSTRPDSADGAVGNITTVMLHGMTKDLSHSSSDLITKPTSPQSVAGGSSSEELILSSGDMVKQPSSPLSSHSMAIQTQQSNLVDNLEADVTSKTVTNNTAFDTEQMSTSLDTPDWLLKTLQWHAQLEPNRQTLSPAPSPNTASLPKLNLPLGAQAFVGNTADDVLATKASAIQPRESLLPRGLLLSNDNLNAPLQLPAHFSPSSHTTFSHTSPASVLAASQPWVLQLDAMKQKDGVVDTNNMGASSATQSNNNASAAADNVPHGLASMIQLLATQQKARPDSAWDQQMGPPATAYPSPSNVLQSAIARSRVNVGPGNKPLLNSSDGTAQNASASQHNAALPMQNLPAELQAALLMLHQQQNGVEKPQAQQNDIFRQAGLQRNIFADTRLGGTAGFGNIKLHQAMPGRPGLSSTGPLAAGEGCSWDDLTPTVRDKAFGMITSCMPYIKLVHFDGGVRHWLQQLTLQFGEHAALSGLASIEGATNLAGVRNMRAFITTRLIDHFEMHVFHQDPAGYAARRLLPEQFAMIAEVIAEGNGLQWQHFDPKVLDTVRDMGSVEYTRARLQRLTAKELSGVQNIPAYIFTLLSKRGKTAKQAAAAKSATESMLSMLVEATSSPYNGIAGLGAAGTSAFPGFLNNNGINAFTPGIPNLASRGAAVNFNFMPQTTQMPSMASTQPFMTLSVPNSPLYLTNLTTQNAYLDQTMANPQLLSNFMNVGTSQPQQQPVSQATLQQQLQLLQSINQLSLSQM